MSNPKNMLCCALAPKSSRIRQAGNLPGRHRRFHQRQLRLQNFIGQASALAALTSDTQPLAQIVKVLDTLQRRFANGTIVDIITQADIHNRHTS